MVPAMVEPIIVLFIVCPRFCFLPAPVGVGVAFAAGGGLTEAILCIKLPLPWVCKKT